MSIVCGLRMKLSADSFIVLGSRDDEVLWPCHFYGSGAEGSKFAGCFSKRCLFALSPLSLPTKGCMLSFFRDEGYLAQKG